jgi:Uma2 family endonuclease
MPAAIAIPIHHIELAPGSAIRINDVTWENYTALLQELGDNRSTRIAYDNGVLEIKMPGQTHESTNRVLAAIALTLAEELGLEFNDLGSMTLNRQNLKKGIEPDSCFYIQNAQAGQGLNDTLANSLPPDLALEIDIASKSDDKLSLYAAIAVPELWIYKQETIIIKLLQAGQYIESPVSRAFPAIAATQLNQWLQLRRTGTDLTVVRAVRQFCRENLCRENQ